MMGKDDPSMSRLATLSTSQSIPQTRSK